MKKILPKQLRFFLADGVREEIGAKISLIGLYTGDEVIVQSELPVQVPGKTRGLALPGLYILIILVNGQGKFKGEFVIYDPNGKPMRRAIEIVNKVKDKTFNVILPIVPFPVIAFGRYRVSVQLDDNRKSYYSFIVRHRDPKAKLPIPNVSKVSKKKIARPSPERRAKKP